MKKINQLINKPVMGYSTTSKLFNNLLPWQITGLTDGEGGFYCSILKTDSGLTGFRVKLEFKVVQKSHSEKVLKNLQKYFSCGSVVIDNRKTETKKYHVSSLSDILNIIIPHFDAYPCLTSKFLNFKDWKNIAFLMKNKEHLTEEGLQKIREISSNMNTGRSFLEKYEYLKKSLNIDSEGNANYKLPEHWVQTFIDGEGMFYNYIALNENSNSTKKNKIIIDSSLEIAQGNHDVFILLALKQFFNGGYIKPKYNVNSIIECKESRSVNRFILRDSKKIIDFGDKYPMLTRKQLDYFDWKTIVEIKNNGFHKSPEGLNLIKEIKAKMNSKRD
jgi:hypothetical protein